MKATLITAATRWESGPLAKGLRLSDAGGSRFEGSVGDKPVVLLRTGMGVSRTAAALDKGFTAGDFRLAISAGLCGAMQDDLRRGDIVADAREIEMDFVVPLRETASALSVPFHFGTILSTNVVLGPEKKRALGAEHRALACDMETAAVRRWAGSRVPVMAVRAVLDEIGEEIPDDAPEDEEPGTMARYALSHASRMPRLIELGLRSRRAMTALARFLRTYLESL